MNLIKKLLALKTPAREIRTINPNASFFANAYAVALEKKFNVVVPNYSGYTFDGKYDAQIQEGEVYDRIVIYRNKEYTGTPHVFVNRETGDLVKPRGGYGPLAMVENSDGTPAVSFNISTKEGFLNALSVADYLGVYLKKRFILS